MVPLERRRWGCFLFHWVCPEKGGGIREAHMGKILRRPPASLAGPRPLLRPGPAAGPGPSGCASGSVPPRGAAWTGQTWAPGLSSAVPLAARPHLRSSFARPQTARPDRTACDGRPSRTPGTSARGTPWRRGMRGTHGERRHRALAEACAAAWAGRGGAAPERANAGPGRGFALRWADGPRPS